MMIAFGNPVYDEIRTPWVSTRSRILSGCATNAALIFARLGGDVVLAGRVGADRRSHYESFMRDLGITTITEECSESGGFGLLYDDRGRRELTVLGRAEAVTSVPDQIADAEVVFLGPVLQETPFDLIHEIRARTDVPLVLDPQGLLRRIGSDGKIEHFKPEGIEEICALCDVVKPNELETEILTGIDPRQDLDGAAAVLKSWGIRTLAITLAEEGSLIAAGDERYRIRALPTTAIDSTGAGDSFAGGLMFARAQGLDWPEAAQWATAVATTMIEHCGPEFDMRLPDVKRRAAQVEVSSVRPAVAVGG